LELGQAMLWLCAPLSLQLPYTYCMPAPPLCGLVTPTARLPPLHVHEYGVLWATPPAVICKPLGWSGSSRLLALAAAALS